ncbi:hypothetical protein FSO04_42990 [Paraburkholderia madseniana]|uniref:HTH luxR-type domain-containing protein n=1 Tax=Paraburkholderia madseniana TaxID=2599607 RepID=A0A6N6W1W4_9BURK|nr:hypothetical protein [Paraburkholderia madseniana]KAE8753838.1 hypothetical protein FSO04_42990 [Paraburkholderia madseniana]
MEQPVLVTSESGLAARHLVGQLFERGRIGHTNVHSVAHETYVVHLLAHTISSGAWFQKRFDVTLLEGEVCHLLLKGMADKQIAVLLNIKSTGPRKHVGNVVEELAVDSRWAIGLAVLNASHKASGSQGMSSGSRKAHLSGPHRSTGSPTY